MAHAIALDFDDATVAAVDAIARGIAEACGGGVATIAAFGVPAHLTLATYDDLPVDRAEAALDAFAATVDEAELLLGSVGVFPDVISGSVMFLAPVMTPTLLALRDGCLRALARLNAPCWDQYRPERWVPHVTLAMELRERALGQALACCAGRWTPLKARLVGVRLAAFPPVATLRQWRLRSSPAG
jgi:2'-5' RNA ligase